MNKECKEKAVNTTSDESAVQDCVQSPEHLRLFSNRTCVVNSGYEKTADIWFVFSDNAKLIIKALCMEDTSEWSKLGVAKRIQSCREETVQIGKKESVKII